MEVYSGLARVESLHWRSRPAYVNLPTGESCMTGGQIFVLGVAFPREVLSTGLSDLLAHSYQ